ncbi:MAG: hypothetical protein JNL32_09025, partial [Candidatus Kapabacteria bacterium]|nr:hypothetical protein [Candidatus Kapabacteria bacterium]
MTSSLCSQSITIDSSKITGYQTLSMSSHGNEVASLMFGSKILQGKQVYTLHINRYSNNRWDTLPVKIKSGSGQKEIKYGGDISPGILRYDNQGKLMFGAKSSLYFYDSDGWNEHTITDTLSPYREVTSVVSDYNNGIYMSLRSTVPLDTITENGGTIILISHIINEVYHFQNGSFTRVYYEQSNAMTSFIMVSVKHDGTLLMTRSTADSSLMYYKDGQWSVTTLQTPIGDKHIQYVKQIVPDRKGGVWFAYNTPPRHNIGFSSGGVSYLNANGVWRHFLPVDGMPSTIGRTKDESD